MTVSYSTFNVRKSFRDPLEGNSYLNAPQEVNKVQGVGGYIAKSIQGVVDMDRRLNGYQGSTMVKELD
jgi:hypothetical protein